MTEFPAGDAEEAERVDEKRAEITNRLATLSLKLGVLSLVALVVAIIVVIIPATIPNLGRYLGRYIRSIYAMDVLWLVFFFIACAIPAIVLGHAVIYKVRRSVVPVKTRRSAVAGLLLGYCSAFLIMLLAIHVLHLLHNSISTCETAGIGFLREIREAQSTFWTAHNIYAGSFAELTDTTNGLAFLEGDWDEKVPKNGFLITLKSTDNGNYYEATASPTDADWLYFFVDCSGVIRAGAEGLTASTGQPLNEDFGPSSTQNDPVPVNPAHYTVYIGTEENSRQVDEKPAEEPR